MPTRPWREMRERLSKLTPEQRASIDAEVLAEVARMKLHELRKARRYTQQTVAEILGIAQGDVSKLEHRTDAYVGTLRKYVQALGGTFRIVAQFPDAAPIEILGFTDIDESTNDSEAQRSAAQRRRLYQRVSELKST